MKIIGYITSFIVVIVFASIWSGYALSVLWAWFIVPAFGLPMLSIPAAIGVSMIVSYITHQTIPSDKEESSFEKITKGILEATMKPAFALGFGWIVKSWL